MNAAVLIAALAAGYAFTHRRVVAGEAKVQPEDEIRALAVETVRRYGFNVSPDMLVAIAFIESSFNPLAVRVEPHKNDASAGLMQTLLGTAQWLHDDFSIYRAKGRPSFDDLMRPDISMYFGAAYLDWLSTYMRRRQSEEWIVRAYNGGPGNAKNSSQTADYFRKYQAARERFG